MGRDIQNECQRQRDSNMQKKRVKDRERQMYTHIDRQRKQTDRAEEKERIRGSMKTDRRRHEDRWIQEY